MTFNLKSLCLTRNMDPEARAKLLEIYRKKKRFGYRAILSTFTGAGYVQIVCDVAKGQAISIAKNKVKLAMLAGCHVCVPGAAMMTTAVQVIKVGRSVHSITSTIYRIMEDTGSMGMVIIDIVIFGEYVPICQENDYDLYNATADCIESFLDAMN